jgi:hypothetical protein
MSLKFILYLFDMKKHIPIEAGDYYLTQQGYRCFTEQYHLKRGYCCESGCKHCPYGYNTSTNTQKSKT